MSDWLLSALADYAVRPQPDLSDRVLDESVNRLIDSVGVAVAAFDADGPTAVRAAAAASLVPGGSKVWGSSIETTLEMAAMANCSAVRYLDYNDAYFGVASGTHPSDIIAALVAVGESCGSTGRELLEAIAVGYEVAMCAADGLGARDRGWDHVNFTALGACCGAARLMRLSAETTAHALSIAVVSHAAMGQTREGALSMWKGLAAPDAVRHAVYACRLAQAGVRAPDEPFVGEEGFIALVNGGKMSDDSAFDRIVDGDAPTRLLETHIKAWPMGIVSQSGVDAALRVRAQILEDGPFVADDIAAIEIEAFKAAIERNGSPEKFRPMTRETADHSLPYGAAMALIDGRLDATSFALDKVQDPSMHAFLADRVNLAEDPELTARYPEAFPTRVTVHLRSGRAHTAEVEHYRGHALNPLDAEGVDDKFRGLVAPVLGPERTDDLLAALRVITEARTLGHISQMLTTTEEWRGR